MAITPASLLVHEAFISQGALVVTGTGGRAFCLCQAHAGSCRHPVSVLNKSSWVTGVS